MRSAVASSANAESLRTYPLAPAFNTSTMKRRSDSMDKASTRTPLYSPSSVLARDAPSKSEARCKAASNSCRPCFLLPIFRRAVPKW